MFAYRQPSDMKKLMLFMVPRGYSGHNPKPLGLNTQDLLRHGWASKSTQPAAGRLAADISGPTGLGVQEVAGLGLRALNPKPQTLNPKP